MFDKFQDVLKKYALKSFRKANNMVEIITDMNDSLTNFYTKPMPDYLTEKEKESKLKMKLWEM